MALVVKDRVRETTTSTGTGTILLNGAVAGFQDFTVIGDSNTTYYTIVDPTTNAWEVGIGTYTASGTTLSRDTILESSTGGTAVNFADGTKDVFVTYPAERSVDSDTAQTLTNKTLTSPTITGTGTAAFGNLSYAGTLTGGTGVINIGSGQVFKDASGNVGIGTDSPQNLFSVGSSIQTRTVPDNGGSVPGVRAAFAGTTVPTIVSTASGSTIARFTSSLVLQRNRGALSSPTVLTNNDYFGRLDFAGYDGSDYESGALIHAAADATPSTGSMPGRLVFSTTPTGSVTPTEKMRITASGNVGIGTGSPTSFLHLVTDIDTETASLVYPIRVQRLLNESNTSTGIAFGISIANSIGAKILHYREGGNSSGGLTFWTKSSTLAGDLTAERMRIDASGNVGIGTTAPSNNLTILGTTGTDSGISLITSANGASDGPLIEFGRNSNAGIIGNIRGGRESSGGFFSIATVPAAGGSAVEHMRINASGNVGINTTSPTNKLSVNSFRTDGSNQGFDVVGGTLLTSRNSTNTRSHHEFYNPNGLVGQITTNGSATAYVTSSDYRLKEDAQPMADSITRLMALNPVNFAWKVDGSRVDGFLAHEVQEFVPEAVTGTKDAMRMEKYEVEPAKGEIFIPAVEEVLDEEGEVVTEAVDEQIIESDVQQPKTFEDGQQWRETTPKVMGEREVPDYQGIDQSKLVPLLTAALKDVIAEVEALKAEIATLKGNA